MQIYNGEMELLENPDLSKGRLVEAVRTVHHAAVEAVEEVAHYETIREYPNGGKDVRKVVDVPGVHGAAEWVEKIPYLLYVEYTPEELAEIEANKKPTDAERIEALEEQLAAAKILLGVE